MLVLAVDTSTPQVTAGIARVEDRNGGGPADIGELAAAVHVDARAHNEVLTPLIRECLQQVRGAAPDPRIDAVVVGCGPGPFTGLRVGMATAASFADAREVPAHGACSLDALALPDGSALPGDVLAVTDARRREVYAAGYRDGERVWGPAVLAASACADAVVEAVPDFAPIHLVGDPAKCAEVAASLVELRAAGETAPEPPAITAAYPTIAGLVAAAIAEAAHGHDRDEQATASSLLAAPAQPLTPLYLRRPDATPPKATPRSPAIPDVPAGDVVKQATVTP